MPKKCWKKQTVYRILKKDYPYWWSFFRTLRILRLRPQNPKNPKDPKKRMTPFSGEQNICGRVYLFSALDNTDIFSENRTSEKDLLMLFQSV